MFKVLFLATIAMVATEPGFAPGKNVAYPGAFVAAPAPIVTALSSQYITGNYNGVFAAPYVTAAAPIVAVPAPYFAKAPKLVAPAATFIYTAPPVYAPYASPYVAAPYFTPSAPLFAIK